ncbi:barstar family protein [Streptosporangium saharense]|uniref:RNAse (Barnase) inhibitor barstar n=1 Tax=Streptosporangium saharense TaxID=1706840 RepID=A0A7W7VK35_9ACTN|nr:barstar family protein [Streptosporangium saharense]MBB4913261.1 RNAse (barnase) inhibitor barstar [Streptosporangium saharense]
MPRGTFEEGPAAQETLRTLRAIRGEQDPGVARATEIVETPSGAPKVSRITEVPEVPGVAEEVETEHGDAFAHRVDGSGITTSAEAMSAIADALSFPDYFGHNLDALYDSLTDLEWLPAGEHLLVWTRSSVLREADPAAFEGIRSVLVDAVADDTPSPAYLSVLLPDS